MDCNLQIDFDMPRINLLSFHWCLPVLLVAILDGCASGSSRTLPADPAAVAAVQAAELQERLYDRFFLEGSLLQMQGRHPDAIREFRRALRFDSTRSSLHFAIANCFTALGRLDSTLLYARRAVAADSASIDARQLLAETALYSGLADESTDNYVAIVRLDPRNIQARMMIARSWLRRDPFRAIEEYEGIRRIVGDDPEVLYNLAELYLGNGLSDRAIETMRTLLHLGSDRFETYRILSGTMLDVGRYDEAIALLDETSLQLSNDSTRELYYLRQIEDLDDRIDKSREVVPGLASFGAHLGLETRERLPKSWRARFRSSMLLYRLEHPGADTMLQHALADPAVQAAEWNEAAEMLLGSGRRDLLLRELAPLAHRYRDDPNVTLTLGRAYYEAGRTDSAERYLRRTVAGDPASSDAWAMLGEAYLANGKLTAGTAALRRAIEEEPGNTRALDRLAHLMAERNENLSEALRLAGRALDAEPENERYLETLGLIYYRLEDPRRALQYLEQVARAGGAGEETLELLGDVQKAAGKPEAARESFERALRLAPGNERLRRKLESVR
jgi:tetratricopeptide (TPR) repeat protein